MCKAVPGYAPEAFTVDSRSSLIAAIYLGIVGPAVFIVQPGFVQGLVQYYGFGEREAGYVASSEMWGIALATLALTFFSSRVNWRRVLTGSIMLAATGNVLSLMAGDVVGFALLRALVGIGSGCLISLTFTIIGLTSNPDRNFGFLIMWILVYGAVGFLLMPLAYATVGMTGVLIFFACFNLSALPFVRYLPASGASHMPAGGGDARLPSLYRALAVSTLFIYFVAQGVVWAYLFLIGIEGGGSEQDVSNGLTLSQFFGIAGALTAALLGNRSVGRLPSLAVGVAGSVISLALLLGDTAILLYTVSVCIFNFAWNMTHPFLLAALASFDRSGQVVVHGVAGQMMGLAIGPALAATVIAGNDYSKVIWLGLVLFVVSLVTIIPPVLKSRAI